MGNDVDLERLYRRNAPVPAGGKVDRAVQLIRFAGTLYRDLRLSYPAAEWDESLALAVQQLVLRARGSLDLPAFAFLSGDDDPWAPWGYSHSLLQCRAAARVAQLGHMADVLIAGSLLSNGFDECVRDDPTPSLVEGYCGLLPMLAVIAAPLGDVVHVAQIDVPTWFDHDGQEQDARFDPAVAALRPDADSEFRRSLLQGMDLPTRDGILAVRASLGLPVEADEARGDMRAMAHFMNVSEDSDPEADFRWVRAWLCLIYLVARDTPVLLTRPMKAPPSELDWVNDWYGVREWPPFPSPRDPELPRLPAAPSPVPVGGSASAFGSSAAWFAATHFECGRLEEAHAWALIAAELGVQQGFLILAQLAWDAEDAAAAADWATRGLALPSSMADPDTPHVTGETPESGLHLLAAVALAALDRVEESARHLVAAASGGNQNAQTILDAMLNQGA